MNFPNMGNVSEYISHCRLKVLHQINAVNYFRFLWKQEFSTVMFLNGRQKRKGIEIQIYFWAVENLKTWWIGREDFNFT